MKTHYRWSERNPHVAICRTRGGKQPKVISAVPAAVDCAACRKRMSPEEATQTLPPTMAETPILPANAARVMCVLGALKQRFRTGTGAAQIERRMVAAGILRWVDARTGVLGITPGGRGWLRIARLTLSGRDRRKVEENYPGWHADAGGE